MGRIKLQGLNGLIQQTAEAGQRHGKPVGVCGEAAADPLLPLILAYTAYVYWLFRGKIGPGETYH